MSTKSTIVLTSDNEHWYDDCSDQHVDASGQRQNAITMEFDKSNIRIDLNDESDLVITITNPDCDLYKIISGMRDSTAWRRVILH